MTSGPLVLMILIMLFWMAPRAWSQPAVPPIVVTSTGVVPATGLSGNQADVALDACGDIYTVEQTAAQVDEIPAGGGAIKVVVPAGGAGYDVATLWIDASKSNLYVTQPYSGNILEIPITNCVPQTGTETSANIGKLGTLSYYWNASAVATDSSENIFVGTDGACCANSNELVELSAYGGANPSGYVLLGGNTNLPHPIESMAIDSSGDIFYADSSGALYELPVTTAATSTAPAVYSTTPVPFGSGYVDVVGVAFDAAGNLYVADAGTSGSFAVNGYYPPLYLSSILYLIPNEATTTASALNPTDQYIVAAGSGSSNPLTFANTPAVSPSGNIFFSTDSSGINGAAVYEITQSNINFGPVTVGNTGTATATVTFNAAETPSAFQLTSASGLFTSTGGTCTGGISYTAGSACTMTAKFAPMAPGVATGSIALTNSTGAALATAYLQGTGLGAGLTLDSGTISSVGSGFTTPMSVAVDGAGDSYFADAGANAVFEFTPGSATAVKLGSGLSKPSGVAVDGAGDVIIADTGNNRIVEVPLVNGALSNSAQITLVAAQNSNGSATPIAGAPLSGPSGITIDGLGNLYIADTGNNRIVYLPYTGSWNSANASTLGSGLTAPLATAVDPSGNLYIADSGSGQIYRLPAPVSSASAQQLVAVGYSEPSALVTDASGSLFVVDSGNGDVVRIPNLSGTLDPNEAIQVGIGNANPYGLAVDSIGNLYVADSKAGAAYLITRTSTSEAFGDWAVGSLSAPLPVQVENEGNQPLVFASPFFTASGNTADFSLSASSASECANGSSVSAGASCELDATFQPTAAGARSETLTLSSNAANALSSQVVLTGNGASAGNTATVLAITSPAGGSPFFGEPITLTATVTSPSGTPAGTAQLLVDGTITAQAALSSSGVATFTLATGLTGGNHSLQAVYLGSSSWNASTSSAISLVVSTAPTTSTMVITAPYVSPYSAVSGASVAFTVTVSSTGIGIPTGTVTFTTGSTTLGAVPLESASGGFQASLTTSALPVGTDIVVATYSGDSNYIGSTASGTVYVVSAPQVVVASSGASLTSNANNPGSITFTATSYGGWTGVVGFSCLASSLPVNARCVFSPGYLDVTASTATAAAFNSPVTMTVTIDQPPQTPTSSGFLWWLAGPMGVLLFIARRRFRSRAFATVTLVFALLFAGIAASGILACTSGNIFTTPTGTSTVTVYASSDPFVVNGSNNAVQTCGTNPSTGQPDTALSPCAQRAFQVSVNVQ